MRMILTGSTKEPDKAELGEELGDDTSIDAILAAMNAQFDRLALENAGDLVAMRENNISRALQIPAMRFLFLEREAGVHPQDIAVPLVLAISKIMAQMAMSLRPQDRQAAINEMADGIKEGTKHFLKLGEDTIKNNPSIDPGDGPHRVRRVDE